MSEAGAVDEEIGGDFEGTGRDARRSLRGDSGKSLTRRPPIAEGGEGEEGQ